MRAADGSLFRRQAVSETSYLLLHEHFEFGFGDDLDDVLTVGVEGAHEPTLGIGTLTDHLDLPVTLDHTFAVDGTDGLLNLLDLLHILLRIMQPLQPNTIQSTNRRLSLLSEIFIK